MYYRMNMSCLPQTICFGRIRQKRLWQHGIWKINYNLPLFAIAGQAVFKYGDKDHIISKGDWLFLPIETEYSVSAQEPFEYYFIHFLQELEPVAALPLTGALFKPGIIHFNLPPSDPKCIYLSDIMSLETYSGELSAYLAEMWHCQLFFDAERKLLLDANLAQLIIMLSIYNRKSTPPQKTSAKLERILHYVQENITDRLTLASLSEHFQLSKSYILRLFRENLNITVTSYINQTKLNYAAVLLKSTVKNVTEIAESLGFTDCYYFSRLFKRQFGISPMEYLKHYRLNF